MTGEDLCAYAELRFFTNAGVRREYVLPEAKGLRYLCELGGEGSASYTAPLLAQALQVSPDLLEDGICKVAVPLTAGAAPTEVGAWCLVPTSGTLVGEPSETEVQCTAPGLRHLLSRAQVYPEVGGFDNVSDDARVFGWMSKANSYWYNASDWSTPLSYGDAVGAGWPTQDAQLITADLTPAVGDVNLFRATFTLAAATRVGIFFAGDDTTAVYLNSELLGTSDGVGITFIRLSLSAGTHTIAAMVTNTYPSQLKFACQVASVTATGAVDKVLLKTDLTHWKTHKVVGGVFPGWTPAAILLQLLDEANARGVTGLSLLTPDFTHSVDSSGASFTSIAEARAFPTGQTSLADVVNELEDAFADFDVRIKPDFTLQAFVSQGTDKSATVWLQPGVNLTGLTYQGTEVGATALEVRSLAGWSTVADSGAISTYGRREAGITSGVSGSLGEGSRLGTTQLGKMDFPKYVYTATVHAVVGAVPFQDFAEGDRIMSPVRGGHAALRVLSIALATPGDAPGPAQFTLEMQA